MFNPQAFISVENCRKTVTNTVFLKIQWNAVIICLQECWKLSECENKAQLVQVAYSIAC